MGFGSVFLSVRLYRDTPWLTRERSELDVEFKTRGEISYLQAIMYYFVCHITQ